MRWTRQTDNSIIGAPAYVNAMVAYAEGSTFEVLDASNGRLLYSYPLPAGVVGAVSVARSQFYVGALDGGLYAFGLGAAPAAPPADAHCPSGLTCRDIGQHAAGSETLSGGVLTVKASGVRITGSTDQYRSIGRIVTGDAQSRVTVVQQSSQSPPAQAGLMVRQRYGTSTDPAAPFFAVLASPNDPVNGSAVADVVVWYRSAFGKAPVKLARRAPAKRPVTLMIQRRGNLFSAGISFDGSHFQLLPGASVTMDLPAATLQGLAVDSGAKAALGTAGFTNLAIGGAVSTVMAPIAPAHACPAPWTCTDIGNPAPPGDTTTSAGTLVLAGTGRGFGRGQLSATNTDSFHFVYRSVQGAHSLSARVTSATAASTAQAGLVMRASAAPSAAMYCVYFTAAGSVTVQWRRYDGILNRYSHSAPTVRSPAYLKIVRAQQANPPATVFSALTSSDGTTWKAVAGSKVTIDMGTGNYLAGLAATSASTAATTAATFASVKLS